MSTLIIPAAVILPRSVSRCSHIRPRGQRSHHMAFWDKYLANPGREFQMGMWQRMDWTLEKYFRGRKKWPDVTRIAKINFIFSKTFWWLFSLVWIYHGPEAQERVALDLGNFQRRTIYIGVFGSRAPQIVHTREATPKTCTKWWPPTCLITVL